MRGWPTCPPPPASLGIIIGDEAYPFHEQQQHADGKDQESAGSVDDRDHTPENGVEENLVDEGSTAKAIGAGGSDEKEGEGSRDDALEKMLLGKDGQKSWFWGPKPVEDLKLSVESECEGEVKAEAGMEEDQEVEDKVPIATGCNIFWRGTEVPPR